MSQPANKPTVLVGSQYSSGNVQTGEVMWTQGGGRASCVWSGSLLTNAALTGAPGAVQSGGSILLFSGAGRLKTVIQHQNILTLSGVQVTFLDAPGVIASGTSFSGQRVVGLLNAPGGVSGQFTLGTPLLFDMPFSSGLVALAPSGTPGFTVSYTPEVSVAFPNG